MGIINYVSELLTQGGIRAEAAWPASKMVMSQTPLAAVSVEKTNRETHAVTILVEVVCDFQAGAAYCQARAMDVCDILEAAGASCTQGKVNIDERASLFIIPVHAEFYGIAKANQWLPTTKNIVKMNENPMEYLCDCSVERAVDEAHPNLWEATWHFTLEEFFPCGVAEPETPQEPFELMVVRFRAEETYLGCVVKRQRRVVEPEGVRQIREGTATGRRLVTIQ